MKKYLLLSCFLGLFSFCHSDTAFGEAAYENSGVVSFYGTYEYPSSFANTQRAVFVCNSNFSTPRIIVKRSTIAIFTPFYSFLKDTTKQR